MGEGQPLASAGAHPTASRWELEANNSGYGSAIRAGVMAETSADLQSPQRRLTNDAVTCGYERSTAIKAAHRPPLVLRACPHAVRSTGPDVQGLIAVC